MKIYTRLNTALAALPRQPLTSRDHEWLQTARELANHSTHPRHRLGALLVHRNDVLGIGWNKRKSHPFQARVNPLSIHLHAEIMALLGALKAGHSDLLHDATMYVVRMTRTSDRACSFPCRFCFAALEHAGIRRFVCYDEHDMPTKLELT